MQTATAQGRNAELQADLERAGEVFRVTRHALGFNHEAAQWHVVWGQFVQAGKDLYPKWWEAVNAFTHNRAQEVDRALGEAEKQRDGFDVTTGRGMKLREKMAQLWDAVGPLNLGQSPRSQPPGD